MASRVPLHHHFRQNGGPSRHAREIIYPHISRTPGGFAWPCACTHTTAIGALWQSSPTPAPLNYSRHAVESFTQSFSYINATQRDWSAARSVSRASSRPFRHGRGGNEGGPSVMGVGGGVAWEGGGVACRGYCISPRGTRCVSLPCWFRVISLWWRYNSPSDAHRVDLLWYDASAHARECANCHVFLHFAECACNCESR